MTAQNRRRIVTAVTVSAIVWVCLIIAASGFGGMMSLYTGEAAELPKWNGWAYFFFSAKEGAMLGAVLSLPLVIIVFILAWVAD